MNRYSSAYPNLIIQRPNIISQPLIQASNNTPKKSNIKDNLKDDLSKTLKYERQKLEQHKHMSNVFKSRNRQINSTCTSCQKK